MLERISEPDDGEESPLLALGAQLGFVGSDPVRFGGTVDGERILGRAVFVAQEESNALEFFGTVSVGEKTVVANPHEAGGEHVKKKPAKKLAPVEGHGSLSVLVGVVLVAESDLAVVE